MRFHRVFGLSSGHARRRLVAAALAALPLAAAGSAYGQHISIEVAAGISPPPKTSAEQVQYQSRTLALGGAFTSATSSRSEERGVSGLFAQFASLDSVRDEWSQRVRSYALIGGGSVDIEGGLGVDFGTGPLLKITDQHAIYLRGGLSAELLGNAYFYSSWLNWPRFELGYHHQGSAHLFELGTFGAPTWVGRLNLPEQESKHRLGQSLEHGLQSSFVTSGARVDAVFRRFSSWNSSRSTYLLQLDACGRLGRPTLCVRSRLHEGPQLPGDIHQARVGYLGVFIGLGPLVASP